MKNSEKPSLHEVILGEMEGKLSLDEFSVLGRILRKGRMPSKKVAKEVSDRLLAISRDISIHSLKAVAAHQIAAEIWASVSEA